MSLPIKNSFPYRGNLHSLFQEIKKNSDADGLAFLPERPTAEQRKKRLHFFPFSESDFNKIESTVAQVFQNKTYEKMPWIRYKSDSITSVTVVRNSEQPIVYLHYKKKAASPLANSSSCHSIFSVAKCDLKNNTLEYLIERSSKVAIKTHSFHKKFPNFSCQYVQSKPEMEYFYKSRRTISSQTSPPEKVVAQKKCSLQTFYPADVFDFLKEYRSKLKEETIFKIFFQICLGLSHLDHAHLVHKDLKLENMLVSFDEKDIDNVSIIFIDLDHLGPPTKKEFIHGTDSYIPDNINQPQTHKADIFALGKILNVMLKISLPNLSDKNPSLFKQLKELEKSMTKQNIKDNINIRQVIEKFMDIADLLGNKQSFVDLLENHNSHCLKTKK